MGNNTSTPFEADLRAEAEAHLALVERFRREASVLDRRELAAERDREDERPFSTRYFVLSSLSRQRAHRALQRARAAVRRCPLPELVRRATKNRPSHDVLAELNRRARVPLRHLDRTQPAPTKWGKAALKEALRVRLPDLVRECERDLIDEGFRTGEEARCERWIEQRIAAEIEALEAGWRFKAYWSWQDESPTLHSPTLHWQDGRQRSAVELPAVLALPRPRLGFLARSLPAQRDAYDRLLRHDAVAHEIFATWIQDGSDAIGPSAVTYLRSIALTAPPPRALEALQLLDDFFGDALRPLHAAAEAYYAERIPAGTDRTAAVARAFLSTVILCTPGVIDSFPALPYLPQVVTRPVGFLFKTALMQHLGVQPLVFDTDLADREFSARVESEWQRLLSVEFQFPVRGGQIRRRGVADAAFGFDVIPLLSPEALGRYGRLPASAKNPVVSNQVAQHLAHAVRGPLESILRPLFEPALRNAFAPLRGAVARQTARRMAADVVDTERARRTVEQVTKDVFTQLVDELDLYFPRPKDAWWRSVGSLAGSPSADGPKADTYPFAAYIKRKLASRVGGALALPSGGSKPLQSAGPPNRGHLEELAVSREGDGKAWATVAALSRATGVPVSTLRGWDAILRPRRGRVPSQDAPRGTRWYAVDDPSALIRTVHQIADDMARRRRHSPPPGVVTPTLNPTTTAEVLSKHLGRAVTRWHLRTLERNSTCVPARDKTGHRFYTTEQVRMLAEHLKGR